MNQPKTALPPRVTFSGQYSTFKEVFDTYPLATNYHSKFSLQDIASLARKKISNFERGEIPNSGWENCRINILLSILSTIANEDVLRVIDVGGGFGTAYINLKISCPQTKVDYTVLELPETVEIAKELFIDFPDVNFISSFPREQEDFDVLHFGSSLQYFEAYTEVLKAACSYKPRIVILTDHPMGLVDTFVCAQVNMSDRAIPINVFNIDEIIHTFDGLGYGLMLKTISHYPFHDFSNYENDVSKTKFYNLVFQKGLLCK